MIIWVYDKYGNQKKALKWFNGFVHDDELGNLDFIEFTLLGETLEKYDYLVWRDEFNEWHEHFVREITLVHNAGTVIQQIYAVNSISELNLSYINERDSYNFKNSVAWTRLLEDTRWKLGRISDLGIGTVKFYHETIYDGIVQIMKIWGGDLSTNISVGSNGVIERQVNHEKQRGQDNGLQFTYGFDTDNIQRKVELDEVYTKIHVFGKGEPTYDDEGTQTGNGRRISFADINNGKDYVEDNAAKAKWGIQGKNGWQHSEGTFVFDDVEDKEILLSKAYEKLDEVKKPRVTYTANVAILKSAGLNFKNAKAGDTCYVRDKVLDERLTARIIHIRRFADKSVPAEVTIGNIVRTVNDVFKDQQKQISSLTSQSSTWNSVAEANAEWLQNMMSHLNTEMNKTGGFVYWDEDEGITVYDKKRENNPTMAIQLKGAGFRIANSKKANGDWDWRTFGTGDGFTADLLNVGTIRCGENLINLETGLISLKNGTIQDLLSNNYWNLGTGEFRLAYNTHIGDKTVHEYVEDGIDDFISATYDPKIAELQAQIDGQIETWYYDYEPKLTNKPASDWNTEDKKKAHEGDLFYWKSKGYAYRFFKDGSTWKWQLVQDTDVTKALEEANIAKDTADAKRRVFVAQPYTPYDVGDLWFQSATSDIMTCMTSRASGSFNSSDWQKRNPYIDKSAAEEAGGEAAQKVVDSQTQEQIFNKLTDSGKAKGLFLEGNQLYINGDYISTGVLTSTGGSTWDLTSGDFKTIFTISSTATNYTNYTQYADKVVQIEMGSAEPFAIYTGSRTRRVYKNGDPTYYGNVTGKKFVGGIVLSNSDVTVSSSDAYLMGSRVGVSNRNYITTGETTDGNAGASFMTSNTSSSGYVTQKEYLTIEATRAIDDQTKSSTGVGYKTYGKAFLAASTYYNQVYIYPPNKSNYTDDHPAYFYVSASKTEVSFSDKKYIELNSSLINIVANYTTNSDGTKTLSRFISLTGSTVDIYNSATRYINLGSNATTICDARQTVNNESVLLRYIYMGSSYSHFKHNASTYLTMSNGSATLWGNWSQDSSGYSEGSRVYVSSSQANLCCNNSRGLFIYGSYIRLQVSDSNYIQISGSECYIRFGTAGWKLTGSGEWSKVSWS